MAWNWGRAAAGLAVMAALTWAFARSAKAPLPPAPAPAVVAPVKPSAPVRPATAAKPAASPKSRAPGLSDPGEALGGKPR
jgi:hypothetical protein